MTVEYNSALIYNAFGLPEATLRLQSKPLAPLALDHVRVKMLFAPVNASDLIPVTGAYRHRVTLPAIAGYEGTGIVTGVSTRGKALLGKRVLPLRGQGTWQQHVDCPVDFVVPVPDDIPTTLAARAYINPLAALLMLDLCPLSGKRVLITAAGSDCAILLAQWAQQRGACEVVGICRSAIHADKLRRIGVIPLTQPQSDVIAHYARTADIVYDAVGGDLASLLLSVLPASAHFISYGLLSGQPFSMQHNTARVHWFHIRHYLDTLGPAQWQAAFEAIWGLLRQNPALNEATIFPFAQWQAAIACYRTAGRISKPLLALDVQ